MDHRAPTLLAVSTGIQRTIDPLQRLWLEEAMRHARGIFTMVLLGRPMFAGAVCD